MIFFLLLSAPPVASVQTYSSASLALSSSSPSCIDFGPISLWVVGEAGKFGKEEIMGSYPPSPPPSESESEEEVSSAEVGDPSSLTRVPETEPEMGPVKPRELFGLRRKGRDLLSSQTLMSFSSFSTSGGSSSTLSPLAAEFSDAGVEDQVQMFLDWAKDIVGRAKKYVRGVEMGVRVFFWDLREDPFHVFDLEEGMKLYYSIVLSKTGCVATVLYPVRIEKSLGHSQFEEGEARGGGTEWVYKSSIFIHTAGGSFEFALDRQIFGTKIMSSSPLVQRLKSEGHVMKELEVATLKILTRNHNLVSLGWEFLEGSKPNVGGLHGMAFPVAASHPGRTSRRLRIAEGLSRGKYNVFTRYISSTWVPGGDVLEGLFPLLNSYVTRGDSDMDLLDSHWLFSTAFSVASDPRFNCFFLPTGVAYIFHKGGERPSPSTPSVLAFPSQFEEQLLNDAEMVVIFSSRDHAAYFSAFSHEWTFLMSSRTSFGKGTPEEGQMFTTIFEKNSKRSKTARFKRNPSKELSSLASRLSSAGK